MHQASKILIGMLLLGALIMFAVGTFYIQDLDTAFRPGNEYFARFSEVNRLEVGSPVTMSGVRIGSVSAVKFEKREMAKPVTVAFWIEKGVTIRSKDRAEIQSESVFGGRYLAIVPSPDPEAIVLEPGSEITDTVPEVSITQLLTRMQDIIEPAGKVANNISDITATIKEGKGTIGRLVNDEKMYEDLSAAISSGKETIDNVNKTVTEAREGKGLVSRLIRDSQLSDDVAATVSNARSVTQQISEGKGTVGRLLKEDAIYEELKVSASEARQSLENIRQTTEKINKGEGAIGKLINDPEAYDKLNKILDNVAQTTTDLNSGDGTLQKLMREPELYDDMKKAFQSIRKSVDEAREQSPIVTFTGVVFGAF
ncbi:MAG TPA: MlaD family protein [Candidatus Brocadiia bacterium]|nr:MlaD family protein [Candidatus Brocadiia bacterium]